MENKYNIGNFGDLRLERAGAFLSQAMIEEQVVCMRKLGQHAAGTKRIHRFFSNDKVTLGELSENVSSKIGPLAQDRHLLVIQDTTEINYQNHAGRTHGLGPVGNGKDIGFFLHPGLVVDAENSTCLGLSSVISWQRTEELKGRPYKFLIEEKESHRWIETALNSKKTLSMASMITIIADRESDIYEEWDRVPDAKTHMINRICHNRKTRKGMLYEELDQFDRAGAYEIEVKTRTNGKGKKREVHT